MNMNKAFNLVFTGMGLWLFLAFFSSQLPDASRLEQKEQEKKEKITLLAPLARQGCGEYKAQKALIR